MRIRWRDLELPTRVVFDEATLTESYGKLEAEPFERGFGTTIGNSLRRVLLSSLTGSAITSVTIEGVQHEFSPIRGVLEDVTDIILNLKNVKVRIHGDQPVTLRFDIHKKQEVRAGDILCDQKAEIVNPDLYICTLTENVDFVATMTAQKGRGYVTAEELQKGEQQIGVIPMDATFSPVRRVRFKAEDTRVGKITNYDKLIMEIWTDGTLSPQHALVEAAKILRKHFNPFVQYFELGDSLVPTREARDEELRRQRMSQDLETKLSLPIGELHLSVRSSNCLEAAAIRTVGELVQRSEDEIAELRNLGKTSQREIKKKLQELGLEFGLTSEANKEPSTEE